MTYCTYWRAYPQPFLTCCAARDPYFRSRISCMCAATSCFYSYCILSCLLRKLSLWSLWASFVESSWHSSAWSCFARSFLFEKVFRQLAYWELMSRLGSVAVCVFGSISKLWGCWLFYCSPVDLLMGICAAKFCSLLILNYILLLSLLSSNVFMRL